MPTKNSWFTIENKKTETENRVVVSISGTISSWGSEWGGFGAKDLINQVNDIDDIDVIEAHINSYGGEVFEGIAIYNWLKSHKAKVETVIDSVAASIASVIFMAGEKRTIYDTSMGMIHLPTSVSFGNADQMRKDADVLDKIDQGTIRKVYRKGVGNKLTDKEIDEMMRDETWLDSDELLEYGFATDKIEDKSTEEEIVDRLKKAANGIDGFEKFGFANAPKRICNVFGKGIIINAVPPVVAATNFPKEGTMSAENRPDSQAEPVDVAKIQTETAKAERARIRSIESAAEAMGVTGEIVSRLVDNGTVLADAVNELTAAKKLQKAQPQNPEAVPSDIRIVADDSDRFRMVNSLALCNAAGIRITDEEKKMLKGSDSCSTLHSLMRASLVRSGMTYARASGLTATDLARESLRVVRNASTGTGDLTNVLADTINKSLGMGYMNAPATWQQWVKVVNAVDFKDVSVPKMSVFGDMETILEGQPFPKGALSDKKESGAVTVKGRSLNVSFQVLTNDDLGAMTRVTGMMGAAYKFAQNKAIYDYLYGTGTGPTLLEADSNGTYTCFNTYRANYASGAGAPSVSTLSTARTAMRNQTAPKGQASDTAQRLNLYPRYILGSASLETTMEQLLLTRTDIASTGSLAYNPFATGGRTSLEMIIDSYIGALTTTGWWLIADQSMIESIVMLALDGQIAPTIRSEESRVGEALGINYDCFGAYAPMAVDFRGMYFHAGA